MKRQGRSLKYYLASAAGFAIGFATVISPFAYYEVKASDVIYQSKNKLISSFNQNLMVASVKNLAEEKVLSPIEQNNKNNLDLVIEKLPETNTLKIEEKSSQRIDLEAKEEPTIEEVFTDTLKFANRLRNGKRVKMIATAYCLKGPTASGVTSKYGIIAADPTYLPIGSIVRVQVGGYTGLYSVLDTGAKIKGRKIDVYLASGKEAMQFGRRDVMLQVLRYGWNPQTCSDVLLDEKKSLNASIK